MENRLINLIAALREIIESILEANARDVLDAIDAIGAIDAIARVREVCGSVTGATFRAALAAPARTRVAHTRVRRADSAAHDNPHCINTSLESRIDASASSMPVSE